MKRRNPRRERTLKFESLEGRKLMAADISLVNGVLTVQGTENSDLIWFEETMKYVTTTLRGGTSYGFWMPHIKATVQNVATGQILTQKVFGAALVDRLWADAGDGDDTVYNDTGKHSEIHGGIGADQLYGGRGKDKIVTGDDEQFGAGEENKAWGRGGDDHLVSSAGCSDTLDGGDGNDLLAIAYELDYTPDGLPWTRDNFFKNAERTLLGGAGDDLIHGSFGDDHLEGGSGNDTLFGGRGNDHLDGGSGNDHLYGSFRFADSWDGNDILIGGSGDDWLEGNYGDDKLRGGDGNDILWGDAGNDVLEGGGGKDVLHGGVGNDKLYGEAGNDVLHGGDGDDQLVGGDGADTLAGGNGCDNIFSDLGGDDRSTVSFGEDDTTYFDLFDSVDGVWASVIWVFSGEQLSGMYKGCHVHKG